MLLTAVLLIACTKDEPAPPADPGPTVPPTSSTEYGVTTDFSIRGGCTEDGASISDVYDGEQAVLVHGDTERDAMFAAQVVSYYDTLFDQPLIVRASSDLTPADRQHHLMIMGGSDTNSLLTDLNGTLPVWFAPGVFTFAGYRWADHGHGLALIHPSPYAADRYVVIYAGNTLDGAWGTFTIPTGLSGFNGVRGRAALQVEGELCPDGAVWEVPINEMTDVRDNWDRLVADLDVREGTFHRFFTAPGSQASDELDTIEAIQEESHQAILDMLEVEALELPISTYLYETRDDKDEATDNGGNAHANDLNLEVHLMYGEGVFAVGAHEDVHVVAWTRIGDAGTTVLGEGLAVMVDDSWGSLSLDDWAADQVAQGTLPTLRDLIDDFWGAGGGDLLGYGAAGHLCSWLRDTHGIDALKQLYVEDDLDAAFEQVLGSTTAEVEAAWLSSI